MKSPGCRFLRRAYIPIEILSGEKIDAAPWRPGTFSHTHFYYKSVSQQQQQQLWLEPFELGFFFSSSFFFSFYLFINIMLCKQKSISSVSLLPWASQLKTGGEFCGENLVYYDPVTLTTSNHYNNGRRMMIHSLNSAKWLAHATRNASNKNVSLFFLHV